MKKISEKEYEEATEKCLKMNIPWCKLCTLMETCLILKIRRKEIEIEHFKEKPKDPTVPVILMNSTSREKIKDPELKCPICGDALHYCDHTEYDLVSEIIRLNNYTETLKKKPKKEKK